MNDVELNVTLKIDANTWVTARDGDPEVFNRLLKEIVKTTIDQVVDQISLEYSVIQQAKAMTYHPEVIHDMSLEQAMHIMKGV